MLINGEAIGVSSHEEITVRVRSLPSGFAERSVQGLQGITDDTPYKQSGAYALNQEAYQLLQGWLASPDQSSPSERRRLERVVALYDKALEQARQEQNPLAVAITLSEKSRPYFALTEDYNGALKASVEAFTIARDVIHAYDYANRFLGEAHEFVLTLLRHNVRNGMPEELNHHFLSILENLRGHAIHFRRNQQGIPAHKDAHRVEPGEIGFSSNERIGTDFLVQCVAPVFQAANSSKTALAHIDLGTDAGSLPYVLDRLDYNDHGSPLKIKLVGGYTGSVRHDPAEAQSFRDIALRNVHNILGALRGMNVNVVSSDILSVDQPIAFVVEPQSFDLFEALPSAPNPNLYIANSRSMSLAGQQKPLHIAFDLSCIPERAPILASAGFAQNLAAIAHQSVLATYDTFEPLEPQLGVNIADIVQHALGASQEHQAVVGRVLDAIRRKIEEMDVPLDQDTIDSIIVAVHRCPIHLGANAMIANQPLMEFVSQGDFIQLDNDGKIVVDEEGLHRIAYHAQPIDAVLQASSLHPS